MWVRSDTEEEVEEYQGIEGYVTGDVEGRRLPVDTEEYL